MIIGSKKVQDFPLLRKDEIEALGNFLGQMLEQGVPPEIPQGIPLRDLCRLVHTALEAFPKELPVDEVPVEAPRPRLIIPPVAG